MYVCLSGVLHSRPTAMNTGIFSDKVLKDFRNILQRYCVIVLLSNWVSLLWRFAETVPPSVQRQTLETICTAFRFAFISYVSDWFL